MNSEDLKARTKTLAVGIVRLIDHLDRTKAADVMGKQVIRSATSVAANYRTACRSRSKADLVSKLGIVEEEADETLFSLEMLGACGKVKIQNLTSLMDEAEQLLKIFAAFRITAKTNKQKN